MTLHEAVMTPDNWDVTFRAYIRFETRIAFLYDAELEFIDRLEGVGRHHTRSPDGRLWFEHVDDAAEFYLRFKGLRHDG